MPADPPAGPTVAALRRVVDDLAASTHAIGELMLDLSGVAASLHGAQLHHHRGRARGPVPPPGVVAALTATDA
ncbi:hypothetical protein AAGT00_00020 (plasmid) [Streptomyces cavourensis]